MLCLRLQYAWGCNMPEAAWCLLFQACTFTKLCNKSHYACACVVGFAGFIFCKCNWTLYITKYICIYILIKYTWRVTVLQAAICFRLQFASVYTQAGVSSMSNLSSLSHFHFAFVWNMQVSDFELTLIYWLCGLNISINWPIWLERGRQNLPMVLWLRNMCFEMMGHLSCHWCGLCCISGLGECSSQWQWVTKWTV